MLGGRTRGFGSWLGVSTGEKSVPLIGLTGVQPRRGDGKEA